MTLQNSATVKVGEKPRAQQHNSLAGAFNSRILSGIGDCAWRIFYYAYSTLRGLRNPEGTNFPAQDEWFKFYAHLETKMSNGTFSWPEAPAGYAEGANVSNPFMAWIFGNTVRVTTPNGEKDKTYGQIHGYWAELTRLGGLEIQSPRMLGMPENQFGHPNLSIVWFDAENQRGCAAFGIRGGGLYKSLSFGISAAARKHLRFIMESPSLGRYAPSYVPDEKGKGGIFRKKDAVKDQIGQAIFYYLSYFRGSEDQRAKHNLNGNDVTKDGFDFETFFSSQFLLAPSYSQPKYERSPQPPHPVIKDVNGDPLTKYDSLGYPELCPESLGLYWSYTLPNELTDINNADYNKITTKNANDDNYNEFIFKNDTVTQFDTNPDPGINQNKFCLSAIFIQSSDFAVTLEGDQNKVLEGLYIDMYVDKKFYLTIPILAEYKYKANAATGNVNSQELILPTSTQYYIYQFNKIHHFPYPIVGLVSFRIRASTGQKNPSVNNHGSVLLGLKIKSLHSLGKFTIAIKFAHVLQMKPSAADAYVMMRIATANRLEERSGGMAVAGHFDSDSAKKVFENYKKFGVVYTLSGTDLGFNDGYVSANPIYESLRKFISSNVKMADRVSLIDYAVDYAGGAHSVLYFDRFPFKMKNLGVDRFRGLGPSVTQVGNRNMIGSEMETFIPITSGKKYIVLDLNKSQSEFIHYRNGSSNKATILKHNSIFTGGNYYYVSYFSSPTIRVYEIDGIINKDSVVSSDESIFVDRKPQKSPGAISNEWSMFMSYNLYSPSNSSAWKPEMYGDIMGALNARCLTNSSALENFSQTSKNVKLHLANVSWRQHDKPLVVESPSAYNYIEGANSIGGRTRGSIADFAKSCPIYQKPYKIVSAERDNIYDPKCSVIKVSLDRRLDGDSSVPMNGKVSQNSKALAIALDSQTTRTDENAVIAYLLHKLKAKHCKREVVGDVSLDNQDFWTDHRPWGCCYPRFYFTKLIPYVSHNSIMYSDHYRQMEYYLRAMCNGFMNLKTELSSQELETIIQQRDLGTNSVGGYDSAIGDYLFEHLMQNTSDRHGDSSSGIQSNMTTGGGGL